MSFKNLITHVVEYHLSGNGIEEGIISVTSFFRHNSFPISYKKSIAYSLLIRSSQYRWNDALAPSKSLPWNRRRPWTSWIGTLVYNRLRVSIEMSIGWQTYRLRDGKAARKKNDLTKNRAGCFQDSLYVNFFSFFSLYRDVVQHLATATVWNFNKFVEEREGRSRKNLKVLWE